MTLQQPALRDEVARLIAEGHKPKDLLGIARQTVYANVPPPHKNRRREALSEKGWGSFLKAHTIEEVENYQGLGGLTKPRMLINNTMLWPNESRRVYDWLRGSAPEHHTAEKFCLRVGLHIQDYFDYCDEHDIKPWQNKQDEERFKGNFPEKIRETLECCLDDDLSWLDAQSRIVGLPKPPGWTSGVDGESSPWEFAQHHFQVAYKDAQKLKVHRAHLAEKKRRAAA